MEDPDKSLQLLRDNVRQLDIARHFMKIGAVELSHRLMRDLVEEKNDTMAEICHEMSDWARLHPDAAATMIRWLIRGRYNGQQHFGGAGIPPTTWAEKWLFHIRPGMEMDHPLVHMAMDFLAIGVSQYFTQLQGIKQSRKKPAIKTH